MAATRKPRELLELITPLRAMKNAYKQMESERYFSESRSQKASKLEALLNAQNEATFIREIEVLLADKSINYDEWVRSVSEFLFTDAGIVEYAVAMIPTVGVVGKLLMAFGKNFVNQQNVEATKKMFAKRLIGEGTLFSILKILSACIDVKQDKVSCQSAIEKIKAIKAGLMGDLSTKQSEDKQTNEKADATQDSNWTSWFTKSKTFLDDLSKFADAAIEFVESYKPEVEQKQEAVASAQSSSEEVLKCLRDENKALKKSYQELEQKLAAQAEESKELSSLNRKLNKSVEELFPKMRDIVEQKTQFDAKFATQTSEFATVTAQLNEAKLTIDGYGAELIRIQSQEQATASNYDKRVAWWVAGAAGSVAVGGTLLLSLPQTPMTISFGAGVLMSVPLPVLVGVSIMVIGVSYCLYKAHQSYKLANQKQASVTARCAMFPKLAQGQQGGGVKKELGTKKRYTLTGPQSFL